MTIIKTVLVSLASLENVGVIKFCFKQILPAVITKLTSLYIYIYIYVYNIYIYIYKIYIYIYI